MVPSVPSVNSRRLKLDVMGDSNQVRQTGFSITMFESALMSNS
jgi:hypothetical protein